MCISWVIKWLLSLMHGSNREHDLLSRIDMSWGRLQWRILWQWTWSFHKGRGTFYRIIMIYQTGVTSQNYLRRIPVSLAYYGNDSVTLFLW